MRLMIIAAVLAMNSPVLADDVHYDAQLAACELVIALDNVAEEADELADVARRHRKGADAKALVDLATDAERLAEKVDRLILSPLERGASFAYARAQLGRLANDFEGLAGAAEPVRKQTRHLDSELELVATFQQDLKNILSKADRSRSSQDDVLSH